MLLKKNFSVVFEAGTPPVRFREEYLLPVRTEEEQTEHSTLYQAAKGAIAKDLGIMRCNVRILKIMETHNHLIVE
jgi:hypothetical protein